MFKPVATLALNAALAGTASPVPAAPATTATPAPMCSAATRPTGASSLPALNAQALCQSISGLPNAQATGSLVQVRGTASTWTGRSGVDDLRLASLRAGRR